MSHTDERECVLEGIFDQRRFQSIVALGRSDHGRLAFQSS